MRTVLLSLLVCCWTCYSYAQSHELPAKLIAGSAHKIEVTNLATTVIAFPFPVRDGDCGSAELLMEKIPEAENIIKLKAHSIHMPPTSLHIFTKDGKIHTFNVFFSTAPATQTYYLLPGNRTDVLVPTVFSDGINEQQLQQFISDASGEKARKSRQSTRFKMQVALQGVYIRNELMLLRFHIRNHSSLPYRANWTNLCIHDKKITRRSSIQQIPVQPIYWDQLPKIEGRASLDYYIIISQVAVPDKKKLTFELQEENGGRRIAVTIRNKDLFKATPL
ncbi:DUF4138 domain-containing protein [Chitinophaga cymbidii]|uniref:Conjugative transposon protein TraN n=1 Tax=Chitinophaga cymbidii TaxID=1096750 RepID=A0A512RFK8_9BACT|nr:DUF4138 domain-containing protein [Chitinophaga cymbidii]GEP94493.1 conjugative transposon protein TraN [Chitinophaga cymbidii]